MDSSFYKLDLSKLEKPIVQKIMAAARSLFFRYGTSKVSIDGNMPRCRCQQDVFLQAFQK